MNNDETSDEIMWLFLKCSIMLLPGKEVYLGGSKPSTDQISKQPAL